MYLLATEKGDGITKIIKQPDYGEGCYSVYRRTFVNKSDSSLRKTIVNLVHPDGGHHKLVFMRYYFKGAEEHRKFKGWLCDTLFENIQEHRFKDEEECEWKQVRTEESCSGDRRRSGRTRALQFCWTATEE